jgi:hypothetical protein
LRYTFFKEGNMVIEWAPFRLVSGVGEEDLFEASRALQAEFLVLQRGFVRRELVHVAQEEWADLVYWQDEASATKAMESAASSPVCFKYFQLMADADHAEPGQGVQLLAVRRTYPEE